MIHNVLGADICEETFPIKILDKNGQWKEIPTTIPDCIDILLL